MLRKSKKGVAVIGGADGPTSIFLVGRTQKKSLRTSAQNRLQQYNYKKAEKKITADAHTLEEVVQYAAEKYKLIEIKSTKRTYKEQRSAHKESLILQHKPELLGEWQEIPKPDYSDAESIREYFDKIEKRSKMIAKLPDSVIPMDFHLYAIKIGDDYLEMEIDYIWNIFAVSYCGNKKVIRQFQKIAKDLYLYYGVSESDIKNKTERYLSLLRELSC